MTFLKKKLFYGWFSGVFLLGLFCLTVDRRSRELNIYAYGTYLPAEIITLFEKETGIKVNLVEVNNNDLLLTKLRTKTAQYDLAVPSSYIVERLVKLNLVLPLDWSLLNQQILIPELTDKKYNPVIEYGLPYSWGVTGIIARKAAAHDFWLPGNERLSLLNDAREVLSFSLLELGYGVNPTDPAIIRLAFQKLRPLKKALKFIENENILPHFLEEEVDLGLAWSSDYQTLKREKRHDQEFIFILPEKGFVLWFDCWVILKTAQHLKEAYRFLQFIQRPTVAARLAELGKFATTNLSAEALIKLQYYEKYRPEWFLKGQIQHDLGEANQSLLYQLWTDFLINDK